MGWRPQLNVVCGRCGKPSALIGHVCVSSSRRKQTLKPKLSFGKCPKCRRLYGANPLLHACAPRSDFKKRKKQFEKEQRDKARKSRPKHDYTECSDAECKRSLCVAFKSGRGLGDQEGYARGWDQGYSRGVADCPRDHKLRRSPVDHVLAAAVVAAAYALFLLLSPTRACRACARSRGPCPRCKGTGRRFRPGASLVHRGAVQALKRARGQR